MKVLLVSLLLVASFILPAATVAADDVQEIAISEYDRDLFYRMIMTMSGPASGYMAMDHALYVWNRYCLFMGYKGGETFDEALLNWKLRQVEVVNAVIYDNGF